MQSKGRRRILYTGGCIILVTSKLLHYTRAALHQIIVTKNGIEEYTPISSRCLEFSASCPGISSLPFPKKYAKAVSQQRRDRTTTVVNNSGKNSLRTSACLNGVSY